VTHSSQSMSGERFGAFAAVVFWFALSLQLVLSLGLSYAKGNNTLQALWTYFAFFTILTNLLAAITLTLPIVARPTCAGAFFARPGVVTAVTAYMVVVGITYNLLLRNVWQPQGWQLVADVLLHSVDPLLFVAYWWLRGRDVRVGYSSIPAWAVYPLAYLAYALARGLGGDFYAYPFIDVRALGLGRVLANAAAIAAGFGVLAATLIALGRASRPRV